MHLKLHRALYLSFWSISLACSFAACSPGYVLRAGWEEAGILWRRKEITKLVASPETNEELKQKLELTLQTREFAKQIGLCPRGSFSDYSEVKSDVLVWVLSASPKTNLSAKTWWFPIVGNIPYKGFFNKEDALAYASDLQRDNYDTYVRGSVAFSTLGWFDDPLLSTVAKLDDIALVNVVIHEITHNTLWLPGHASFNETLANVIGSLAAQEFFRQKYGEHDHRYIEAQNRWLDELKYADYLDKAFAVLHIFYSEIAAGEDVVNGQPNNQILEEREKIFSDLRREWELQSGTLRTQTLMNAHQKLNNAVILAQRVYLDRPQAFVGTYESLGYSLARFIAKINQVVKIVKNDPTKDPYQEMDV